MMSAEEYKERYYTLVEAEINASIGSKSKRLGPTYKKNFIEFYKSSPRSLRIYLRSFIFFRVKDFRSKIKAEEDSDKQNKLEKKLNVCYSLFEELLEIRGLI